MLLVFGTLTRNGARHRRDAQTRFVLGRQRLCDGGEK
jgi:hypothetical protein